MNPNDLAWLRGELGPQPSDADLEGRLNRLGSVTEVALEVLRERRGRLLASPLKTTVNNVATVDNTGNLTALDQRISHLEAAAATDDRDTTPELRVVRRRRNWTR